MDALNEARRQMASAEHTGLEGAGADLQFVMAYAAIAQTEQLKRIADALDLMAHPNRIVAPDAQDYYSEDEYHAAAELFDYHKNSRPGESMGEYKIRIAELREWQPLHTMADPPSDLDNF